MHGSHLYCVACLVFPFSFLWPTLLTCSGRASTTATTETLFAEKKLNFSFGLGICFWVHFTLQFLWSHLILNCSLSTPSPPWFKALRISDRSDIITVNLCLKFYWCYILGFFNVRAAYFHVSAYRVCKDD